MLPSYRPFAFPFFRPSALPFFRHSAPFFRPSVLPSFRFSVFPFSRFPVLSFSCFSVLPFFRCFLVVLRFYAFTLLRFYVFTLPLFHAATLPNIIHFLFFHMRNSIRIAVRNFRLSSNIFLPGSARGQHCRIDEKLLHKSKCMQQIQNRRFCLNQTSNGLPLCIAQRTLMHVSRIFLAVLIQCSLHSTFNWVFCRSPTNCVNGIPSSGYRASHSFAHCTEASNGVSNVFSSGRSRGASAVSRAKKSNQDVRQLTTKLYDRSH